MINIKPKFLLFILALFISVVPYSFGATCSVSGQAEIISADSDNRLWSTLISDGIVTIPATATDEYKPGSANVASGKLAEYVGHWSVRFDEGVLNGYAVCGPSGWSTAGQTKTTGVTSAYRGCACSILDLNIEPSAETLTKWFTLGRVPNTSESWGIQNEYCRKNCPTLCAEAVRDNSSYRNSILGFATGCPLLSGDDIPEITTKTCPAGQYLPAYSSAEDDCVNCEAGFYCAGGTYSLNSPTTDSGTQCPENSYSESGWANCKCNPGYSRNGTASGGKEVIAGQDCIKIQGLMSVDTSVYFANDSVTSLEELVEMGVVTHRRIDGTEISRSNNKIQDFELYTEEETWGATFYDNEWNELYSVSGYAFCSTASGSTIPKGTRVSYGGINDQAYVGCWCKIGENGNDGNYWTRLSVVTNNDEWYPATDYCRNTCPTKCAEAVATDEEFREFIYDGVVPVETPCDPGYEWSMYTYHCEKVCPEHAHINENDRDQCLCDSGFNPTYDSSNEIQTCTDSVAIQCPNGWTFDGELTSVDDCYVNDVISCAIKNPYEFGHVVNNGVTYGNSNNGYANCKRYFNNQDDCVLVNPSACQITALNCATGYHSETIGLNLINNIDKDACSPGCRIDDIDGCTEYCIDDHPKEMEPGTAHVYMNEDADFQYAEAKMVCNSTPGDPTSAASRINPNVDFETGTKGVHCWVKWTSIDGNEVSASWVYYNQYSSDEQCAHYCGMRATVADNLMSEEEYQESLVAAALSLSSLACVKTQVNCTENQIRYTDPETELDSCVEKYFEIGTVRNTHDFRFGFHLAADGVFYVDWGDDTPVQKIDKTGDATPTFIYHDYSASDGYTIKIGRTDINGYYAGDSDYRGVITFGTVVQSNEKNTPNQIKTISGSLGALFPTIGNGETINLSKQPRFVNTFNNCENLESEIPDGMFNGITGVPVPEMFYNTFAGCTKLSGAIRANLFAGIHGQPAESMFSNTFYNCHNLESTIPPTLFAGISGTPQIAMYANTFCGCKKLYGEIPENLFGNIRGNPADNMYAGTFDGCEKLDDEIPPYLFGNIYGEPANWMYYGTFANCKKLHGDIPGTLFGTLSGDPAYMMYSYMFYNDSLLTGYVPINMFENMNDDDYESGPMDAMFYGTSLETTCPSGMVIYDTNFRTDWSSKVACSQCQRGLVYREGVGCVEPGAEFICTSDKWLHVGADDKMCLSGSRLSNNNPAMALKINGNKYYLSLSDNSDLTINEDSNLKMHVLYNGTVYNVHDESVSE